MTPNAPSVVEVGLDLGLALVVGLPLGWARERSARAAGLRTYPLLSACVCGFLLVGRHAAGGALGQADVLFAVLSGIGFVAAGAIVKSSGGVHGLTGAVCLWLTGAVGAAVAYGSPLVAGVLSVTTALALRAPSLVRRKGEP